MAHNPEIRAAAMSALLAGESTVAVAREFDVPATTVSRWRKQAREEAGLSDDISELLTEYLAENLRTLSVQTVVFSDPEWLGQQTAADVAILHGVLADKSYRLLEALVGSGVRHG